MRRTAGLLEASSSAISTYLDGMRGAILIEMRRALRAGRAVCR
jgi:predicted transcriptional regulator